MAQRASDFIRIIGILLSITMIGAEPGITLPNEMPPSLLLASLPDEEKINSISEQILSVEEKPIALLEEDTSEASLSVHEKSTPPNAVLAQETISDVGILSDESFGKKNQSYLGSSALQWEDDEHDELLDLNFKDAELSVLISYIEKKFGVTFILDDQLNPAPQGGKKLLGTKLTFKTHQSLKKREVWDIFLTFLDMAGLGIQPGGSPHLYRITATDPKSPFTVSRGALPTYIGVDYSILPNNDQRIRYVYFVENTSLDVIKNVLDMMRSPSSPNLIIFPELRAIVITDKAAIIRSMLDVVRELDRINAPETMAVISLKRADASKIAELYKTLTQEGPSQQQGLAARLLGGRKQQTTSFFGEGLVRIIPEARHNYLFLLGPLEAVKRVESFIRKELDGVIDAPFTPLHVYELKYIDAEVAAAILKEATLFQAESEAAKFGGVRDGDKFFKPLNITPEKSGNRLIINADYEDFVKIQDLLRKIDVEQPQVALKVLILNVDLTDDRQFGIQLRNKKPGIDGLVGNNVNFQTSGLDNQPVVENTSGTGATRLLGDLVRLASAEVVGGATYLTLGSDQFGVWGLLRVLETYTNVSIVANPFLVATHKYPSVVSLGETRRVVTGTTLTAGGIPLDSFDDLSAKLEVFVVPLISIDGQVTLEVRVKLEQFTEAAQASGNRTIKEVKTSVIVADNEVLALGGLIRDNVSEVQTKVPVLGDIPVIGWFFKNKAKTMTRSSLLILITPEIIPTYGAGFAERFTDSKLREADRLLGEMKNNDQLRDPIHRWFFYDTTQVVGNEVNVFVENQDRYIDPAAQMLIEREQEQRKSTEERIAEKQKKRNRRKNKNNVS
jgi:general secretion pathway protein D